MAKIGYRSKTDVQNIESEFFANEFSTFKCLVVPRKRPWKKPHYSLTCSSWNGPELNLVLDEISRISGFIKACHTYNILDKNTNLPVLHFKLGNGPVMWIKNAQNGSFLGSIRNEDETQNCLSCLDNKGRDYFKILYKEDWNKEKTFHFYKSKDESPFAVGTVMKVQKKSGLRYEALIVDFIHSNNSPCVLEDRNLLQSLLVASMFFISVIR